MISIVSKTFDTSKKWVLKNLKYQEPAFYARLFDDSEEGPFEVSPGHTKVGMIMKPVHRDPKLYVLMEINISCEFCSL